MGQDVTHLSYKSYSIVEHSWKGGHNSGTL